MNSRIINRLNLFILILLLFVNNTSQVYAADKIEVLVIYSDIDDRNAIYGILDISKLAITNISMSQSDVPDFDLFDIVIFASSDELNMDNDIETSMSTFMQIANKSIFVLTPYLDDLDSSMLSLMGIDEINDMYGDQNITKWDLNMNINVANFSIDDKFNYLGPLTEIVVSSGAEVITTAISSNDTDSSIMYPLPVLVNNSDSSTIITAPISLVYEDYHEKEDDGIKSNALPFPSFITTIISTVIDETVERHIEINANNPDNTNVVNTPDSDNPDSDNPLDIPIEDITSSLQNNIDLLIIFIIALLALAYRKVFGFFRWLQERILGLGVLIFGAYFNVHDRNLNHGEVMLNQYRSYILDILDSVGEMGIHLREIKSLTNLGSGSLLWHLQVLEDFGLIYKTSVNRNTVFIGAEYADNFDKELKALDLKLKSKHSQTMILKLYDYRNDDEVELSKLIDGSDMNRKTALRIIKKLESLGIIEYKSGKNAEVSILSREDIIKLYKSAILKKTVEDLNDKQIEVKIT